MKKYVFKLRIPSDKDYYSMNGEERKLTENIYKFYKNSLFIILTKEKNNHYLCAICSDHKRNHCIKEGELWINYQFLVKISGNCLEKTFVTDLNMNRIADKINSNYKGTNRFPKRKNCNHSKNKKKNVSKSKKPKETKYKASRYASLIDCSVPIDVHYSSNSWSISHPISAGRGNF